jgi:hypothetical protein
MDGIRTIVVTSDASQVRKGNSKEDSKGPGKKAAHSSGPRIYARHTPRLEIERSLSRKKQKTNLEICESQCARSLKNVKGRVVKGTQQVLGIVPMLTYKISKS